MVGGQLQEKQLTQRCGGAVGDSGGVVWVGRDFEHKLPQITRKFRIMAGLAVGVVALWQSGVDDVARLRRTPIKQIKTVAKRQSTFSARMTTILVIL